MTEDEKRKIINETIKNILGDTEIDPNDPERHFCVYMHTNKVNGKMYIGMTGNIPEYRWGKNGIGYFDQQFYNAILKYGWDNFEHEIIQNNLLKHEAVTIEGMLITNLNTLIRGGNGYNIALEGIEKSDIYNQPIYQFDLNGNFINEYQNVYEAMKLNNYTNNHSSIYACVNQKIQCKTAYGYIWILKSEVPDIETFQKEFDKDKYRSRLVTEVMHVLQYSLSNKLLGEFKSITDASIKCCISRNAIQRCISGFNKTAGGYIWKEDKRYPRINRTMKEKQIVQLDPNGIFINWYESINEAYAKTGITKKSITRSINKERITGGGYIWMDYHEYICNGGYIK